VSRNADHCADSRPLAPRLRLQQRFEHFISE
jgi:hypothetical protein